MRPMPSERALEAAFPGLGRELRRALVDNAFVQEHPAALSLARRCWGAPPRSYRRLIVLNAILEGHGIEAQAAGKGPRSPGFQYVNMGDTYATTIVRFDGGVYRVTDWGSIVERGRYD